MGLCVDAATDSLTERTTEEKMKTILKNKLRTGVAFGCLTLLVLFIVFGRSKGKVAPPPSPPEVEVVEVEQKDVQVYSEWIGTLDGMVNAEIKAQVSGYLLRKNYTEGSLVNKGQLLFEIDPRPLQAALDQAKGDLAKAEGQLAQAEGQLAQANSQLLQARAQLAQSEANQQKTQLDVDRYTPLVEEGVITRQEFDNATQANIANQAQVKASGAGVETSRATIVAATAGVKSAKAAVQSATAAVQTAELNLSFTRITSLIDGIAGIAPAQVGDLVGPTSGNLTTVSTVDPIKVYFTLSEQEYLSFTKGNPLQSKWGADDGKLQLDLVLSDGTTYAQKGRFFISDRQVDQKLGSIRLAGLFPNPGNKLRPGQYAKVRAITGTKNGALLVPQRAVTELQGSYGVAVVGADNKVTVRPVKVGDRTGALWIIEEGLQRGEKVVAEGTQKVRPDALVNPKPLAPPSASSQ
jgi:membrane fusion protein (multidrug efflux system)